MMNVFIDANDKLLAAIDYTIGRYGHESWFPAALKDTTTKYLLLQNKNASEESPLKIFRLRRNSDDANDDDDYYRYGYSGHHYIIDQIEKYALAIKRFSFYKYLSLYLVVIIIFILILLLKK